MFCWPLFALFVYLFSWQLSVVTSFILNFDVNLMFPGPPWHQCTIVPLFHYTGQYSYFTGNQLISDCSDVRIIKALQIGVRVIKLDMWPNSSKDDTDILHRSTEYDFHWQYSYLCLRYWNLRKCGSYMILFIKNTTILEMIWAVSPGSFPPLCTTPRSTTAGIMSAWNKSSLFLDEWYQFVRNQNIPLFEILTCLMIILTWD